MDNFSNNFVRISMMPYLTCKKCRKVTDFITKLRLEVNIKPVLEK